MQLQLASQAALPKCGIKVEFASNFSTIVAIATELIARKIAPTKPIQDLLNDAVLQAWAQEGMTLHRNHQFGEGGYEQIEQIIEELLAPSGRRATSRNYPTIIGTGAEAAPNWKAMRSPETYLGHGRSEGFSSPELELLNRAKEYSRPDRLRANHWALSGRWVIGTESAITNSPGGRITYRFQARDVHLVMGPTQASSPIRFRVSIDGERPGASHGVDVDDAGRGTVAAPRMYQLIRQQGLILERELEIEFEESGVALFAFTFG